MNEVSVIIPNYNHAPFLKQRIDSVFNQTFQDFEVIILDDCSTDNSREIIEGYRFHPKVKQIAYNNINSGSAFRQWQKGIELSKGEYLWVAESDDYCHPEFLETVLKNLKENNCSLSFCQSERVDENGIISGDYFYWTQDIKNIDWNKLFFMNGKAFIKNALQYKNAIPNASAVIFRKKEFDLSKIVNYKIKGDWLFWIKYLMSENMSYSPVKLNYFRSHSNTTRNYWSTLKVVRSNIEELGIKYFLYKSGLIKKRKLKRDLHKSIDISLPYFKEYKRICFELNLPFSFLLYFFFRKAWLKLVRTISGIKSKYFMSINRGSI